MLMQEEREKIVEFSKKLLTENLTKGTSGNISILDKKTGYIAITPSGMDYNALKLEDIVIIDFDKNIIDGIRKPSSECDLHIEMYKVKSDARSIVHTHSLYCTILSCLNVPLESVHYVLADTGVYSVPVAPYFTYGTKELADSVASTIGNSNACLMANHGMITCGKNLNEAFSLATTCEWVAEIQWHCMAVGKPNILLPNQMDIVINKFREYGQLDTDDKKSYFG